MDKHQKYTMVAGLLFLLIGIILIGISETKEGQEKDDLKNTSYAFFVFAVLCLLFFGYDYQKHGTVVESVEITDLAPRGIYGPGAFNPWTGHVIKDYFPGN